MVRCNSTPSARENRLHLADECIGRPRTRLSATIMTMREPAKRLVFHNVRYRSSGFSQRLSNRLHQRQHRAAADTAAKPSSPRWARDRQCLLIGRAAEASWRLPLRPANGGEAIGFAGLDGLEAAKKCEAQAIDLEHESGKLRGLLLLQTWRPTYSWR
jgi:hypothetical protein